MNRALEIHKGFNQNYKLLLEIRKRTLKNLDRTVKKDCLENLTHAWHNEKKEKQEKTPSKVF